MTKNGYNYRVFSISLLIYICWYFSNKQEVLKYFIQLDAL